VSEEVTDGIIADRLLTSLLRNACTSSELSDGTWLLLVALISAIVELKSCRVGFFKIVSRGTSTPNNFLLKTD
jgi:hypothetical protein